MRPRCGWRLSHGGAGERSGRSGPPQVVPDSAKRCCSWNPTPRLTLLGAAAGDEGERGLGDERGVRAEEAEERREHAGTGERERRSSKRASKRAGTGERERRSSKRASKNGWRVMRRRRRRGRAVAGRDGAGSAHDGTRGWRPGADRER